MADIGIKIGIDGEKDFKHSLTEINSAFRVLKSEMVEVSSEFEKNDKSIESASAKNKVLNKEIDAQKDKIALLKEALANASESFGENDKRTQAWATKLNYAQADLNKMEGELKENNQVLESNGENLDENSKNLDKYGNNAEEAGKQSLKLGDIIKASLISEAIISGIKKLGEAFQSSVDYIKGAVTGAAQYGDEFLTLSTKTGISAKSLQEYSAIAELVDTDLNTFTNSLTKTVKSMHDATNGSKNASEAYKKLGVSVKDSNGNLRDSEEVFWDTIDALGRMENETERDAIAMQILGKSASELKPLIAQGSQGITELTNKAYEMGAVLSDETLQSLGNLDDQMQIWQGTLKATSNLIGALFAPAMTEITKSANQVGASLNKLIKAMLDGDENLDDELAEFTKSIEKFSKTLQEKMPEFLKLGGMVIRAVFQGLWNSIQEHIPQIAGALLLIAGAIVAFGPTLMAAFAALTPVISAGLALLSSLIITWPIAIGASIVGALALFWPQISKLFSDIWSGLSDFISKLFSDIWSGLSDFIENLWVQIKGFLGEHWDDLLLWIFAWPVALIKTLSDFWPQISSWLSNLWGNISNQLDTIFQNISTWLSNLWSNISSWFSQTFANIKNWWSQISSNAGENSKKVINTVIDWFKQIPQKIWDSIIGAVSKVTQWGSQMASSAKTAANNVWNSIVNTLSGLPSKMISIGGDLVRGLWNGINDMTNWIKDKIKGFGDSVVNGLKKFFGIASPSKLMENVVGKNLALGIGEGFEKEMKTVANKMINAMPTDFGSDLTASNLSQNSSVSSGNAISLTGESLVIALQSALSGMAFKVDGDKIGELVVNQVERVVYQ